MGSFLEAGEGWKCLEVPESTKETGLVARTAILG